MRIGIAADHRGFEAKRRLVILLRSQGHEVVDFGCHDNTNCDYVDYGLAGARAVSEARVDAAILLDSSGIGMSIVANKVCRVRAALAHDELTARIARESNHCNVLCLAADLLSESQIRQIVSVFLQTPYGDGRHARRVEKLLSIEEAERMPVVGVGSSHPPDSIR